MIKRVAESYQESPIKFFYLDESHIEYKNIFKDIHSFPTAVIIRPKKERYIKYQYDDIE